MAILGTMLPLGFRCKLLNVFEENPRRMKCKGRSAMGRRITSCELARLAFQWFHGFHRFQSFKKIKSFEIRTAEPLEHLELKVSAS